MVMYHIYNSKTLEKLLLLHIKCITQQLGMKNYLLVISLPGIIGT